MERPSLLGQATVSSPTVLVKSHKKNLDVFSKRHALCSGGVLLFNTDHKDENLVCPFRFRFLPKRGVTNFSSLLFTTK